MNGHAKREANLFFTARQRWMSGTCETAFSTCLKIVRVTEMENWSGSIHTNSALACHLAKSRFTFTAHSLKHFLKTFLCTDASNLEEKPKLFLPLHLHLHHSCLSTFNVRDRRLQLWKQVDDTTLTHQDCTVGAADSKRWEQRGEPNFALPRAAEITWGVCTGLSPPGLGSEPSGVWSLTCPSCRCIHAEGLDLHEHAQISNYCD